MGASQNCLKKSQESNQEIIQSNNQIIPIIAISKHHCEVREQPIEFNYLKPKQHDDDQCLLTIVRNYYYLEHQHLRREHRQYKQNQSVFTARSKKHQQKSPSQFDLLAYYNKLNVTKSTQFKTDPSKKRRSISNDTQPHKILKHQSSERKSFSHLSKSVHFEDDNNRNLDGVNYYII